MNNYEQIQNLRSGVCMNSFASFKVSHIATKRMQAFSTLDLIYKELLLSNPLTPQAQPHDIQVTCPLWLLRCGHVPSIEATFCPGGSSYTNSQYFPVWGSKQQLRHGSYNRVSTSSSSFALRSSSPVGQGNWKQISSWPATEFLKCYSGRESRQGSPPFKKLSLCRQGLGWEGRRG